MKRFAIYMLLIAPYVLAGSSVNAEEDNFSFVVMLCVFALVCGLNMVNALTSPCHEERSLTYLFWCMVLKLCMVPLYGISVYLLIQSDVATQSVSIVMFSFAVGLILILTTTSYGWRGLWVAKQEGLINRQFLRVHACLQMCYIFDVLSAMYCYFHIRRAAQGVL